MLEQKEFINALRKMKDKRVILFGASNCGLFIKTLLPVPVAYFVDNDPAKQGTEFQGLPVYGPGKLLTEDKNALLIVIASYYWVEINAQLEKMGFGEARCLDGFNLLYLPSKGENLICTEYPINPYPRYGYGKPAHKKLYEIIDVGRKQYIKLLQSFISYKRDLMRIPLQEESITQPFWLNPAIPGLDAVTIYAMLAMNNAKRYFEVGSGSSTKFAACAIKDHKLATEIVSFDPWPRAEIDMLCHRVYRQPLEEVDTGIFGELEAGDILFVDNSHCCFMNSDVTTFFLDILPYLQKGVIVGIHDIFLPLDYPVDWIKKYYTEQYLLACYLLAGGDKLRILLPNAFIETDKELAAVISPVWDGWDTAPIANKGGGIFWFTVN